MLVVCCLGLEWLLLGFDRNFPHHGSENDLVFEKPRDWGVMMDNHDQSRIGWLVGKNDGRRGTGAWWEALAAPSRRSSMSLSGSSIGGGDPERTPAIVGETTVSISLLRPSS